MGNNVQTRFKNVTKRLYKAIKRPEMRVLPGHLSYFFFLSMIPLISLIGLTAGVFNIDIQLILDSFTGTVPKAISDILLPFFSTSGLTLRVSVTTILGFFIASNAPHAIIIASNELFGIEKADSVRMRIKALFMTLEIIVLLFTVIIILGFGDMIMNFIFQFDVLKNIDTNTIMYAIMFRWPIAFIIIFIIIKNIFTIAPERRIPSRYMNKGAFFTTTLWIISTAIFSFYVTNVASYTVFYGGLANIVITMLWLYFISYIMIIGIAINSSYYNHKYETVE